MFGKCFLEHFLEREKMIRENDEEKIINHISLRFSFSKKNLENSKNNILLFSEFLFFLTLFLKTVLI